MIDLYTWPTPNGHKIHIMLEECGLVYNVIPIDIGAGDQFDPDFLKISPNNKMPAMVDHDGPGGEPYPMFESGAMLMYLAEKTGKFMPTEITARYRVIQWLMFQMGHIGPMLGQAHHFRAYAPEQIPYAVERYTNEATRLYRVCETRLAQSEQLSSPASSGGSKDSRPVSISVSTTAKSNCSNWGNGQTPGGPGRRSSALSLRR